MTKLTLPVLVLSDTVLLPSNEIRADFDSEIEKRLFSLSEGYYSSSLLIVHSDLNDNKIDINNLPQVGIVGLIKLRLDMPNGKTKIVIMGEKRVKILNYKQSDQVLEAEIDDIEDAINSDDNLAYGRILYKKIDNYIEASDFREDFINDINKIDNLSDLTDFIVANMPLSLLRKREYINETSAIKRCEMIIQDINKELEIAKLEKKIDDKLSYEIEKSQKEYVLREKIRVIKEELGDVNDKDTEIQDLRNKIDKLKCNKKIKERLYLELNRYEAMTPNAPEVGMIRNYIDWLLDLPWNKYTKDNNDLKKVKEVLDSSHFGLEQVKQRIVEYLAVKKNTNNLKSPIICLVGPPGVGKTTLAKSIADCLNRKCTKISVGGINDEAEIVGHRRTYIGAAPGLIIQGMKKAGSSNPVFIIDEIDKMTKDIKGDPASSLLEILDPEQNKNFSDHYIEEEFDLSQVMFITTANYYDQIPSELRDRLEIIELSSYTEYEKLDIAKNYLIPRELKEHGLTDMEVSFSDEVILTMIRSYTKEAGVRELSRNLATVLRKIVKDKMLGEGKDYYNITDYNIEKYLGKKKYQWTDVDIIEHIGVVNGLAYTPYGGDTLPIEAVYFPGKGNIIMTGSLGDVMKESANLALDYIKANYDKFGIDYSIFETKDIHIHVPEGAIPKDGPSAGVTLTTTLISLLTNTSIHTNVAMTGEMTLRGKVLAIGGLKEKVIGAHRNGIRTIFIPSSNEKDLDEIPIDIKREIKFILVDRYMDIYKVLFRKKRGRKTNDPRNIRLLVD
ncbi:MAG: endopeptidase La [Tenericutes bacterium]|nr:endopeptidase La [Mycoplasmatota bacterium]